jgi:hypothetical protein
MAPAPGAVLAPEALGAAQAPPPAPAGPACVPGLPPSIRPLAQRVLQATDGDGAHELVASVLAARWPRPRDRPSEAFAWAMALVNAVSARVRPGLRLARLDTDLPANRHRWVLDRERQFCDEGRSLAVVAAASAITGAGTPAVVKRLANFLRVQRREALAQRLVVEVVVLWDLAR